MAREALARDVEARRVGGPSVMRCGVLIFAVKAALRVAGYGRAIEWIKRRLAGHPAATSLNPDIVKRAERAVAIAAALYPGRARCLEQSLVLYYVLRRQGIAVSYCQGVQPYPFEAHAWVEYRGEVINDIAEHVRLFVRLPEQLP